MLLDEQLVSALLVRHAIALVSTTCGDPNNPQRITSSPLVAFNVEPPSTSQCARMLATPRARVHKHKETSDRAMHAIQEEKLRKRSYTNRAKLLIRSGAVRTQGAIF